MSISINQDKNINRNTGFNKPDENILVIKRNILFEDQTAFSGIKELDEKGIEKYLQVISDNKEFLPRSEMEMDINYKQIIPYLIFKHENKYFLMQRQSNATEQRLKNKFSLGIGGHIREEDIVSANIIDWSKREFEEEIEYNGDYKVKLIGLLNDDSDSVGQVHVGFVFLIEGNCDTIKVKSELKSGQLLELSQCIEYYDSMENWSKLVFNYLQSSDISNQI